MNEAAAKAAGYAPDPRPAREIQSQDGTCPTDDPVKGFTNAQGKQVYLAPGDAGYATQKAARCFSDTNLAEYYGYSPAGGAASAAPTAKPSAAPSPSGSAKPSSASPATLSPASLDFGQVAIGGTSATQTVTLTNTSTQTIQVRTLDPRFGGANAAQFQIKFSGCNAQEVAPGGTCTYTVTFRPTGTAGVRNATLEIVTGAGTSNTITLTGTTR